MVLAYKSTQSQTRGLFPYYSRSATIKQVIKDVLELSAPPSAPQHILPYTNQL